MSKQQPRDDREQIDIVVELPPSAKGTYQYEREGRTTLHGDASGEWTLDEHGELEDIVFVMSPLYLMKLRRQGLVEPRSTPITNPSDERCD